MPIAGTLTFYDLSSFGISWPPPGGASYYGSVWGNSSATIGTTPPSYDVPVDNDDALYNPDGPGGAPGDPTGQIFGAGTPIGTVGDTLQGNGSYLGLTIAAPDGTVVNFNWIIVDGVGYLESEQVPPGFFEQSGPFTIQSTKSGFKQSYMPCFVRGTRLQTPDGDVAIEDLRAGDLVTTLDDGPQEISWIGSQKTPAQGRLAPIKFMKGALGNTRDLLVSPLHRMVLSGWKAELLFGTDEVLATARSLVNDKTIMPQPGGTVEYFHILFDRHQIIFAEGIAIESFYPGGAGLNALEQKMSDEILQLFPNLLNNPDGFGPVSRKIIKDHETYMVQT